MIHVTPDEIPLPAVLDPILDKLAALLPRKVYSVLIIFLSNILALLSSLFSIIATLIGSNFSQWNSQTIIPPLITILAAYLAIVNLYNTTRWFIRMTFWFLKWGVILSVLLGGVSWFMANLGQEIATQGVVSSAVSAIWDFLNIQEKHAGSPERHRDQTRSRTRSSRRPKPWDSFNQHKRWNDRESREPQRESENVRLGIMKDIAEAAARVQRNSGWWGIAKGIVEDASDEKAEKHNPNSKGKAKSASRSR